MYCGTFSSCKSLHFRDCTRTAVVTSRLTHCLNPLTPYSHQPRTSSTTYETVTIHMFCLGVNITSINSPLLIGVCLMLDVSFSMSQLLFHCILCYCLLWSFLFLLCSVACTFVVCFNKIFSIQYSVNSAIEVTFTNRARQPRRSPDLWAV